MMADDAPRADVAATAPLGATPVDEFYIGYDGGMPPGTRRVVRLTVAIAAVVAIASAAILTVAQRPFAAARFEFGEPRLVTGWLTRHPAPSLLVKDRTGSWSRYWLVSLGKFGAGRELGTFADGWVQLSGTLAARGRWQMLEIVPGSVAAASLADPPPPLTPSSPTAFRGRGEVVDSKCFLGVMNPGERTVHRDCAVRCLSGGIPPMFSYRDGTGDAHLALLLRADGEPYDARSTAGRPIELSGHLSTIGDIEVLVVR
jgi:hypothetical protein